MFFVASNLFTYRMLPIATLKVSVAFVMDPIGTLLSVSRKLVAQVVSLLFLAMFRTACKGFPVVAVRGDVELGRLNGACLESCFKQFAVT